MSLIEKINDPKDIKEMDIKELNDLAGDVREIIIKKVSKTGGHMGPNLGFIEPTIAMHYVFNSPVDKIVYDVSHQCYTHKILTGRKDNFIDEEKYEDISGYTNPHESKHDFFQIGHTSTSISLATGLAKARDVKNEKGNVIAVIGDGSLTGGEAYEGLNNAAVLNSNIIIVVNDNEMSIAKNQGGLVGHLDTLRKTNGKSECNMFKALGFDYYYVEDGNDVESLINAFKAVKDTNKPVVVHIHTNKGKGYKFAEENKEAGHWVMPSDFDYSKMQKESYSSILADFISKKCENNEPFVGITAATPNVCGFTPDLRAKLGKHYVDVGIAEQHAVALASGIAKNGGRPIFGVYSSFIQRTYDQLSQDLALNNNPAVIVVFDGGLSPMDATHVGQFDISMISNIPNLVYLAPANKEEYIAMLNWATTQTEHPVIIRAESMHEMKSTGNADTTDYSDLNKFKVEKKGNKVAIIGLGYFYYLGEEVAKILKDKLGIDATVINPHYISGIDEELLENLKENHDLVITLEDGILDGGFGEKISRFYGSSNMKVLNYGGKKEFTDREDLDEIYIKNHLKPELILQDIQKVNVIK